MVNFLLLILSAVETLVEKFSTDLSSLQPTTESNFLNPRLSISTRFLSRFQSRFRWVNIHVLTSVFNMCNGEIYVYNYSSSLPIWDLNITGEEVSVITYCGVS